MKYTHVLWDFNGTLLDDVGVCIDCANALLTRRKLPLLQDVDAYRKVFTFPIIEYYKRIGLCTSPEDYTKPADEWVKEYLARIPTATVYDGVYETLQKIKDLGITQTVLSATEYGMLCEQIDGLHLRGYFDEIVGCTDVYAHGKTSLGLKWRERHPSDTVILFGDSDHDAEVAAAMNVDCVLIASGHQSKETLKKCGVPVVDTISDALLFL